MARGYVYEVSSNPDLYPVGYLREDDLYEEAGHAFEYVSELNKENQERLKKDIVETLKKIGCKMKEDSDNNIPCIIVTESAKVNYFRDRFRKLQEYVGNLTLKEFSGGDCDVTYDIKLYTDNIYGDAIYLDGSYYNSFDSFIRYAVPEKRYYFGNVLLIH